MQPVSIIIAARNEASNLKRNLPFILKQDYAQFEVLVVNDRSEDDTLVVLKELQLNHANLRVITIEHLPPESTGKKNALSEGINAAQHEVLLFTDADCKPVSNQWVLAMTQALSSENADMVLGVSQYENEQRFSLLNEFIQFETLITAATYTGLARIGFPYMGVGRNLAYKKTLFLQNKGFETHKHREGGDDDLFVGEIADRAKIAIADQPEAQTISTPKRTWIDFIRQKRRHLTAGLFYRSRFKWIVGFLQQFVLWTYITLLVVSFLGMEYKFLYIISLGAVRLAGWIYLWRRKKKMGFKINSILFPIYEFLYVIYFLLTGLSVILVKKNKWI